VADRICEALKDLTAERALRRLAIDTPKAGRSTASVRSTSRGLGKALRPSEGRRYSKLLPPQESFHGLDAFLVEASVAIDTCAYSSVIPDAIGIFDATSSVAIEICNELIATRLEIRRRLGDSGVRHRGSEDNGDQAQQPNQEWVPSAAHQRMLQ
jgi:hypothetical protein